VGISEVAKVIETGNAHARMVTMNSRVKPEFSDLVRAKQR
jgi:hypothetical protein